MGCFSFAWLLAQQMLILPLSRPFPLCTSDICPSFRPDGAECVCGTSVSRSRFLFFRRFLNVRDGRVLSRGGGSIFLFQGECTQYSKHPLSCFTLRWADRHKSLRWWAERGVKDKLFALRRWWKGAAAKQRKDYISRSTARWAAVYFKKSTEAQVSGAVHDKTLKSALQNVNIFRRWSDF